MLTLPEGVSVSLDPTTVSLNEDEGSVNVSVVKTGSTSRRTIVLVSSQDSTATGMYCVCI